MENEKCGIQLVILLKFFIQTTNTNSYLTFYDRSIKIKCGTLKWILYVSNFFELTIEFGGI